MSPIRSISIALAILVSGCQTTTIRSAWFDTGFAGPPMRKVVVLGNLGRIADDRVLEDSVVARLRTQGVDAVSGHAAGLGDARMPEADFKAGVVATGAQGLLLVTLLGVDTRFQVSTTMVQGGMGWGRGPWGSPAWGASAWGAVPVQQVSSYQQATAEAKLFDVATRQVVWAATTTTINPASVAREAPGFADLVVGQLSSRGVIAGK